METQIISVEALQGLRTYKLAHLLIDVREAEEFEAWHIPQAVSAPFGTLWSCMRDLGLPTDALIILYCCTGRRARWAAQKLAHIGYTNVHVLRGTLSPTAIETVSQAGT